ncbi:MAG TPA: TauD/TfdA family dioxygenase [Acidimicrobiales bacterium]|nr:TauD/TfdA family dioxygenase [Acidimicrobiales bacterium]
MVPLSSLTIERLGTSVGAEAHGVKRSRLLDDDALPARCMDALEEHGVLVFRDLHVDDDTQVAFSKRLDDVGKAEPAEPPRLFTVTLDPAKNPAAEYLRGTFAWHIDGAQDEVPTKATMLSAKVVAAEGGDTEFASTYAAYDELEGDEKQRFDTVRVLHSFEASQRLVHPDPSPEELADWREKTDREHPLVWRHRSGRRSLVIGASADYVVGMDRNAGKALLDDLLVRATDPARVYRHAWSVGDLVIWDNTGVMHRACPYDPSSSREMHRTTMSGDEPIR